MSRVTTQEEVETFLSSNTFTGYQAVPLPYGLAIEGNDKTQIADKLLDFSLEDKSLLDVGTYYGFFPIYAMQRGAKDVVGLEADPERFQIARQISEFYGESYQIVYGKLEDIEFDSQFDVVLLLNVLHHLVDPIAAMIKLVSLCKNKLIVEFCLPSDSAYIKHTYLQSSDSIPSTFERIRAYTRSRILQIATHKLPMMAIGNWEYHRTFYFSREAFYNLFVVHLKLFDNVVFRPGLTNKNRAIAVCSVKAPTEEA